MKICPVGSELSHAEGRTDTLTLIVTFCNFAIAPKNVFGSEIDTANKKVM
jgi:hypothetical protein